MSKVFRLAKRNLVRYDPLMRPIPSHIVRALEIEAPQFVNAISRVADDDVALPWTLFDEEPDLLYNCVWYALSRGKNVVIETPQI